MLEFVDGRAFTRDRAREPERFFPELKASIDAIHAVGVAHADLKEKNNVLETPDGRPVLIDFGAAIRLKSGFHPVNALMFRLGCRLDTQAYLRHKYGRHPEAMDPLDEALNHRTVVERASRGVREVVKWIARSISNF